MRHLTIYDNQGETFDRITIVFNNEKLSKQNGRYLYEAIGASETGTGFFQHTRAIKGKHLGRKVQFQNLTKELQNKLREYFTA